MRARWSTIGLLLFFTALVALSLDLGVLSYDAARSSRLLLVGAVLLFAVGVAGFIGTIVFTRRTGPFYRKRREIAVACGSALVTTVAVLVVSLALRIGPEHTTTAERWDPEIGSVPGNDELIGGRQEKIDPTREQVLLIGDSLTVGWTLKDEEVVGRRLQPLIEPYQSLNLSKTGWSIDQYYLYLKRVLPRTRPKLVIVAIFGGNDFEVTGRAFSWGHTKPFYRMRGDELVRTNPSVLDPNCFDHLSQSLLFRPVWSDRVLAGDAAEFFCRPEHPEPAEVDRVIDKLFSLIEEEARRFDAPVMFVLLPERRNWFADSALVDCKRYQQRFQRLLNILERGDYDYYDFSVDQLREDPEQTMFLDDGSHFNARGQEFLAQQLAREIRSRGWLD